MIEFVNADICDWQDLRNVRAHELYQLKTKKILIAYPIFMHLTLIFQPPVMRHIGRALRNTTTWKVFASCSNTRDWIKLWEQDKRFVVLLICSGLLLIIVLYRMQSWWEANIVECNKCPVILCGSRSGHTLYLFKRKSDATL